MERLFNEYGVPDEKNHKEVIALIADSCRDLTDRLWKEVVEKRGFCHRDLSSVVEDHLSFEFCVRRVQFGVEEHKRRKQERQRDQDKSGG